MDTPSSTGDTAPGEGAAAPPVPAAGTGAQVGARALRNTVLILVARVLSRIIALFVVVIIGNTLGDDGFGRFQTAVTYSALVSVVADLGLSTLYVREGARRPAEIGRFLNNVASVKVLLAVMSLPLLLGGLALSGLGGLLAPTFAIMVLAAYALLLRNTLYALQRLGLEIVAILLETPLLLVIVLMGLRLHGGVAYYLWAYAASYGLSCLYFVVALTGRRIARLRWQLEPGVLRPWLAAGLPLAVTYIFTTVYFKIDVPILQRFRSFEEVGWYTLAYKPFEALLFVPMTLRTVIFPIMSVYHRTAPELVAGVAARFFKALAILGWPMTVGIFLLAPQLNDLLHLFPQSAAALRILALAIVFLFVDNTFAATFNAIDRQGTFAVIALTGLVVNVALNLVLIPPFGYLGASWAVVITEAALVGVGWAVLRATLTALPVWRSSWRVLVAGLIMGGFILAVHPTGRLRVVAVIAAAAGVYGVALVALGGIDPEERRLALSSLIPRGGGR